MPAYNGASYIKTAIASILNQTLDDFELLIVDDGSTDNTVDIISSFTDHRIRMFRLKQNAGIATATNAALSEVRGEYIVFMDNDDISTNDRLYKSVSFLQNHPELTGCGGMHIIYNKIPILNTFRLMATKYHSSRYIYKNNGIHSNVVAASCLFGGILFNPTVCFRSSALSLIPAWMNPDFKVGADDDFYERLQAAGARFAIMPCVLLLYRRHRGGASRVFGNQAAPARAAISGRAVLRLLPAAGEEDLHLHSRLVLRDRSLHADDLPLLRAWLERLLEAGSKVYGTAAMETVIGRNWQRACAIAATHSFFPALSQYLAFPARPARWHEMCSFLYQCQRRKFG
jgi:glycosyltransferase involved in cell wall biosynthesis